MKQNLKRNWHFKIGMENLTALKRLKNLHFNAFLLRKVCILYELKKYRGVIFHDTEEWCKIWRKMDLWFGKWHEEFGKFSPEHSKVSELGLWWNSFAQSRKYELKIHRGVMCHENEEWCKIWKGIDLSFLKWHEEFDEFWLEYSKI